VGARSRYETVAKVVIAFTRKRTWTQADLAREVALQPRQLRKVLMELSEAGVPLEREEEHPQVYWSVPKGWLPGGVSLDGELVTRALGLVIRLPPGSDRDHLLEALAPFGQAPGPGVVEHHGRQGDVVDQLWRLAIEGIEHNRALRVRYRSTKRGSSARSISPQRIDQSSNHLLAFCHKAQALRRFHFDRVEQVAFDACEQYVHIDKRRVDAFLTESVDGFHDPAGARELAFYVRPSAAPWVAEDLPDGLEHERTDDGGLYVHGYVAGLGQVARYVVGLGAEAEAETPELRDAVEALARGALESGGKA